MMGVEVTETGSLIRFSTLTTFFLDILARVNKILLKVVLQRQQGNIIQRIKVIQVSFHLLLKQTIKLMDPRPYTYEYRKPRFSNPTFQSNNLYQSIYHVNAYGKRFLPPQKIHQIQSRPPNQYHKSQEPKKVQSYQPKPQTYQNQAKQPQNHHKIQSQRYHPRQTPPIEPKYSGQGEMKPKLTEERKSLGNGSEKYQLPPSRSQHYMSNYGNRLLQPIPGRDQDHIYERQEKAFNIVTNYPKDYQVVHRKYPKYTLQHGLIERNVYPPTGGY